MLKLGGHQHISKGTGHNKEIYGNVSELNHLKNWEAIIKKFMAMFLS
jgi:hypothetical protein